jgi:hypothetical protein
MHCTKTATASKANTIKNKFLTALKLDADTKEFSRVTYRSVLLIKTTTSCCILGEFVAIALPSILCFFLHETYKQND